MKIRNFRAISFKNHLFLLTIVFYLLCFTNARSLDSVKVKTNIPEDIIYDTKIFFNDGGSFYTSPLKFSGREWIYTLSGAAALSGIMMLDDDVKRSASRKNGNSEVWFWSAAKNYGEAKYWAAASVLVYSTGLFIRNEKIRVTGRLLMQSMIYSGILSTFVKTVTGRTRPYKTDDQFQFNWFETNNDELSFPSGHSTVAFAVSTVFAERIDTWWARTIFYSMAAATAFSRVRDNQHWISDAVAGSLIGFGAGYFVVNRENEREKKQSGLKGKMNFYPSLNGIRMEYNF